MASKLTLFIKNNFKSKTMKITLYNWNNISFHVNLFDLKLMNINQSHVHLQMNDWLNLHKTEEKRHEYVINSIQFSIL